MRKFYIYLIIHLFAISYPYGSCKALPQQKNGQTFSTKKKRKRNKKRNDGLVIQIVTGVFGIVILCFSSKDFLRAKIEIKRLKKKTNYFHAREERVYKQMKRVHGQIELMKWNVEANRKKFTKEELRQKWLEAARTLDFDTLEWLLYDKQVGGGEEVTKYQEDGKTEGEEKGFNVLHYAAEHEHLMIVTDIGDVLKKYKEAFNALDSKGRTAMDIAYEKKNYPIVNRLKVLGGTLKKHANDAKLTDLKNDINQQKHKIHEK